MTTDDDRNDPAANEDWYDDVRSIIHQVLMWLLFVWACLLLALLVTFLRRWLSEPQLGWERDEVAGWLAIGSVYVLPAWLGIPTLSRRLRNRLPTWVLYLANAPGVLLVLLIVVFLLAT